jgi:hypothetical protein
LEPCLRDRAVSAVLPVAWWLKLVIGLGITFVLLPILGWVSGPLGRTLRFLLDPVMPLSGSGSHRVEAQ